MVVIFEYSCVFMARARRPALGFAEADILRAEVVMLTVRRVILRISYSVSGLGSMSWWFAEEMNRHWQSPTFMQSGGAP